MKSKVFFLMLLPFALASCARTHTHKSGETSSNDLEIARYIANNAKEWDDAFKDMYFTNYTMDVYVSITEGSISLSAHNHIEVSDDALLYQLDVDNHQTDLYFAKDTPDWLVWGYDVELRQYKPMYLEDFNGRYNCETVEELKDRLAQEATLHVSFESYYNQFVFDEEKCEYYCKGIVVCDLEDSIYSFDLAARNVHVKFFEGDIVSMSAEYVGVTGDQDPKDVFDLAKQQGQSYRFDITNIGTTVVQEPRNIDK